MQALSIAIVDDHPIIRNGLGSLVEAVQGLSLIACGASAEDAVRIAEAQRPNVLLMDIGMPGDAFAALAAIARTCPWTRTIAFTATQDAQVARKAMASGASGFVDKASGFDELINAVQMVAAGGTYVSQAVAARLLGIVGTTPEPVEPELRLTVREEQIVGLLLKGASNKEIAAELDLSESTVKGYMTTLMQKMNAKNRLEVVIAARERRTPRQRPGPRDRLARHFAGATDANAYAR
jgi:two-component system nitrate/nitrite response regulator NarL